MNIHNYQYKIYRNPFELNDILEARRNDETIVFGNGCFDVLHVGHMRYLYSAKDLGDILIIAVNTDASIARIKPEKKLVFPEDERLELIAGIGAVDYVVPLEEDTPISLIKLFRPNIHTKGTDYIDRFIPERATVESYGGRVELVGDPKNHSSTQIINGIKRS